MATYGKKAGDKVERAMHEKKEGTLKSGRSGKKVTSRKQAIAIGLSEARKEGAKVPAKKGTAKKTTAKNGVRQEEDSEEDGENERRRSRRSRSRPALNSRAPGRCCGADRWRRRSGSCRPACRRATARRPGSRRRDWPAAAPAKTWPMPSRILRVSGLTAKRSRLVGFGQPLLVEARRVDRLLHGHVVVDDVDDRVQHRGDDPAAARRADDHHRPAVLADDGRAHRAERPLARRDRVGLALDQAVDVRHAELGGEVVHLVVEQDAGSGGGDLGAEPVVERVGDRDRVALGVDDRVVGRVAAFVRRDAGLQVLRDCRPRRIDGGADLCRVALCRAGGRAGS